MTAREFFPLIFAAAGLSALGYAAWLYLRVRQSQGWRTAPGQIVQSEKTYQTMRHGGSTAGGRVTKASIRYRYHAEGGEYTGDTVCVGQEFYTSFDTQADRVLARYPRDAEVTVYYNPENPADCCLERRSEAAGILAGVGIAALALGLFL